MFFQSNAIAFFAVLVDAAVVVTYAPVATSLHAQFEIAYKTV